MNQKLRKKNNLYKQNNILLTFASNQEYQYKDPNVETQKINNPDEYHIIF